MDRLLSMKVKELLDRYGLKTRQSIYNWCDALKVTLGKDSAGHGYATPEQIALFDQLAEHLKGGGKLDNFTPVSITAIDTPIDTAIDRVVDTPIDSELNGGVYQSIDTAIDTASRPGETELLLKIIQAVSGRRSLVDNLKDLVWLAEQNIAISSADVEQLVGTKPHGETFSRGSFRFIRSGKIGNQLGWKVERA
jgi:hypothetical protein